MKHKTEWREIDNGRRRIRAEYGVVRLGDQEPYLSVTGTTHRRVNRRRSWAEDSGGQLHEEIAEHFPELEPLLKWHLCFRESGPLHYVANAQYWARIATGLDAPSKYGPDPTAAFKSTVVFGEVDGDELPWSNWCQCQHTSDCEECDTLRQAIAELRGQLEEKHPERDDALTVASASVRRAALDAHVKAWCEARFAALMTAFHAATFGRVPDDQLRNKAEMEGR